MAAFIALVSAVVRTAIRVRRVDLGGVAQHGQVDLATQEIAADRHGPHGGAVVTLAATEDAVALGLTDLDLILARKLECGLYRFRSAAGEEDGAAAKVRSRKVEHFARELLGYLRHELRSMHELKLAGPRGH